ncbi:MAG: flavodoxin-dependent (E)-4-hydroxy-3-methylbut-2-enyl-diphosphate synthase [Chitinispirillaceae bacterium]|jgi:(E)-4-hydroxy-3-methylbut-2-enyl-diphosphate synthase|nr:flavodoxin-dependent (E)-4-hydroxy-3-methylbut-2-enyl-diphosphate synthase [Chitinispirillaceae bacterium]
MTPRKNTWAIKVRNVTIGGSAPIAIQSMTNTDIHDTQATLGQIERLRSAGCQIVRLAIPDEKSIAAFKMVRSQTDAPLVADVHFHHTLAIAAMEAGADKVRINPGNIGSPKQVRMVVDAAKAAEIPLRIGVNSGSLEKAILDKYKHPTPEALCESAAGYISMMEKFKFRDFVLSIKASDVATTIAACRLLSKITDIPQHIGITEAGTVRSGSIRSAVGIGTLLAEGIGDTIRVSLAGDPVEEIFVAREILKSLGLAKGPVVIACPTCGRTQVDMAKVAARVESMVAGMATPIRIACMGCVVNGPGEARDADIGIAGGKGEGLLFVKGKTVKKVKEEDFVATLKHYIEEITGETLK